jgi:hypothetical protein
MIVTNYWMKLSRIKLILAGIMLVSLGPIISMIYTMIFEGFLFHAFNNQFFLIPSISPFADWWVHYYIIWPFYIPGMVIMIIGIILIIKMKDNS